MLDNPLSQPVFKAETNVLSLWWVVERPYLEEVSNYQQGGQFGGNLLHSNHPDVKWATGLGIWIWTAWMLPFKSRVYIPAQHQMCSDVIAGHAYTSVLAESCDLSAWRAAPPNFTQDVVAETGHSNLSFSVCWPSWLPFCLFYFPQWLEMPSWVQQGSTTTTKNNPLLLCLLLGTETILQRAKTRQGARQH